jgi:ABC-type phosphate/phosphonate transport system substrate-binding protein
VFTNEGTLPQGSTKVLAQTSPYDHCNMTVTSAGPGDEIAHFGKLLLDMAYDDPVVRPLLDLEGLKQWVDGRTVGYALLERAVDETGFYDESGGVHGYDDAR